MGNWKFVWKYDSATRKETGRVTFEDIENEIRDTERELVKMLDELTGNDADMAGIAELKKFFGGDF